MQCKFLRKLERMNYKQKYFIGQNNVDVLRTCQIITNNTDKLWSVLHKTMDVYWQKTGFTSHIQ
jgi:hypothetical protein